MEFDEVTYFWKEQTLCLYKYGFQNKVLEMNFPLTIKQLEILIENSNFDFAVFYTKKTDYSLSIGELNRILNKDMDLIKKCYIHDCSCDFIDEDMSFEDYVTFYEV